MHTKEEIILQAKKQNPTFGYTKIARLTGLNREIVRYHLTPLKKEKHRERMRKHRKSSHPLYRKLVYFCAESRTMYKRIRKKCEPLIPLTLALNKFGDNPKCYLTGMPINLMDKKSYSLDHIIPICKGGKSTLENCGLCLKNVNIAKNDKTPEEFIKMCQSVIENIGNRSAALR